MTFDNPIIYEVTAAVQQRDGKALANGEFQFLCPAHADSDPSACWNPNKGAWFCHACNAKGGWKDLAQRLGIHVAQRGSDRGIVAAYDYLDAGGKLLFQVCRTAGKRFFQRRPNGAGGWTNGLKGVVPVLYRLPELLQAVQMGEVVFIPEGERDCNNLVALGLTATTNPLGAGKWREHYSDWLKGATCIILPDNDEPGKKHAKQVAQSLCGKAVSVKVLELSGLPKKGDVSDWLAFGGTKEELLRLAAETPEAEKEPKGITLPLINAGIKNLPEITGQAIAALDAANKNEPHLFLRGGPVRFEKDDQGSLITRVLTPDRMRWELARAAWWYEQTKGGMGDAKPPMDVVRDVLASPLPFPPLTAITCVPTFTLEGTLEMKPGYHPTSKVYYAPADGLRISEVPEKPTQEHVAYAKELILMELLGDFPFAGDADKAHAVALLLLPFCRNMINGCTPLHLIEASSQGAGKGLLADVLIGVSAGGAVGIIPPPKESEELRKSITSRLLEGRSVVLIDNVHSLTSSVLSAALTANAWDDRILGKNETVQLPIRWTWVVTANNAVVSTDIARRSARVRLIPQQERPWLRKGFRHPNLRAWAADNRGKLVWAALTLVQAWLAAGRPQAGITPLGSFESWSEIMGGILANAGIPGFLENVLEFYETADQEGTVWREFVAAWWEKFKDKEVKASDLFPLAEETDGFDLGKGGTERAQKTTFGIRLARQKDRIFSELRIELAGTKDRLRLWRLNPLKATVPLKRGTFGENPCATSVLRHEDTYGMYLNVPLDPGHAREKICANRIKRKYEQGLEVHRGTGGTSKREPADDPDDLDDDLLRGTI